MDDQDNPLTADQIVKALGGASALDREPSLGARRSAISNWPKDGIPSRHWPALARLAAKAPETRHITIEVLERHTHPANAEAA